jgi:hypothetical protein
LHSNAHNSFDPENMRGHSFLSIALRPARSHSSRIRVAGVQSAFRPTEIICLGSPVWISSKQIPC